MAFYYITFYLRRMAGRQRVGNTMLCLVGRQFRRIGQLGCHCEAFRRECIDPGRTAATIRAQHHVDRRSGTLRQSPQRRHSNQPATPARSIRLENVSLVI